MRPFNMEKRQQSTPSQIYNTPKITQGGITTAAPTGLVTASAPAAPYTTVTEVLQATSTLPNGQTTLVTSTRQVTIVDASQYTSLLASESSQRPTSTAATSSAAATTSAAAQHHSNSNLGTLIPAIVAPVAAILLLSFGLFWFFMRRRHHKEVEKQEFVMASKKEKAPSRGNSTNSGTSSTRELVRPEKLDKVPMTSSFEISRPSMDLFPPTVPTSEIGLARPMTPPDKLGNRQLPPIAGPQPNPPQPTVPNFSGLRPGSALRENPKREQFGQNGPRNRSNSATRGPPPPGKPPMAPPPARTGPYDPRGPPPGSGPRPGPRSGPNYGPIPPPNGPRPGTQDSRGSPPGSLRGPSPVVTSGMRPGNRAAPPKALEPFTPTGAFNGASPISQYSPIVKEAPTLGMVLAESEERSRGPPVLPALRTLDSEPRRADSPNDENVLSNENMRIARLANSSRLGFNSPTEKSPIWPSSTKMVSPELPAPLSRGELEPRPAAAATAVTAHKPASKSTVSARHPSNKSRRSRPHSRHQADRASVVSRVSTDDGYVDMDIDDKSDVSSLDEREKWQLETKLNAMGSSSHLPPSAQGDAASNPNYRDRDSEGPFVLSRY